MEGRAASAASKSATDPSTSLALNLFIPARTRALGSCPAAAAAMATAPPAAARPNARARPPPAPASSARLHAGIVRRSGCVKEW